MARRTYGSSLMHIALAPARARLSRPDEATAIMLLRERVHTRAPITQAQMSLDFAGATLAAYDAVQHERAASQAALRYAIMPRTPPTTNTLASDGMDSQ